MKKILETAKELAKSNKVKVSVYVIAGVLVLLFVFQAGMFVGFKKASFSFRVGENYFREMNGRRNDPDGFAPGRFRQLARSNRPDCWRKIADYFPGGAKRFGQKYLSFDQYGCSGLSRPIKNRRSKSR